MSSFGSDLTGRQDVRANWEQMMSGFAMVSFFAVPGAIEVNHDNATARSHTQELLVAKDGGGMRKIIGAYDDTLVKQCGQWLFARRGYNVLHDEHT